MEQTQKNIIIRLLEKAKGLKNMFKNNKVPKVIAYPILSLLIILLTTILSDAYISNNVVKSPQVEGVATDITLIPSPTVSQTPEPLPVVTPDPDPVINCLFTNIPDREMRKSACNRATECEIGDKWVFYSSKDACIRDQKAEQPAPKATQTPTKAPQTVPSVQPAQTYSAPSYPPCTVYYPALGYSQTYSYTSPETCAMWQASNSGSNATAPAPSVEPVDNSAQVASCKAGVQNWMTNQLSQYGGSGRQAAQEILNSEYQSRMSACEN